MNETFISLFILGTILIGLQELAMLPWLTALGTRTRQRLRDPRYWLQGVGIALGAGLLFAYLTYESNEPRVLARWGRFYMSILHLQLAADFFVLVYGVMLAVWPKGGAVALAAFREGVRQPMFWLLLAAAVFLMAATPLAPYFTFGEDLKMVKEICYVWAMLFPVVLGVVAASMSVHEEIEGRTAVTLMSKPISRRQFLLGKFAGILSAAGVMTLMLGWLLVWIVLFKQVWDPPIARDPAPDPAWVVRTADAWFPQSAVGDFVKGIGFWIHEAGEALPGLVLGFCQVMVLVAVAVALATRVPMVVNVTACLVIYFLGHLTAIMTEVSRNSYALINFMAQLFDTVLPGLDLFDVGTAIIRDVPPPPDQYAIYTANVALYGLTYTAIALLVGLILFEDRDLA
jgi:hypothetical protein